MAQHNNNKPLRQKQVCLIVSACKADSSVFSEAFLLISGHSLVNLFFILDFMVVSPGDCFISVALLIIIGCHGCMM